MPARARQLDYWDFYGGDFGRFTPITIPRRTTTMTATTDYSATNTASDYPVNITWVRPSALNPRKHFDEAKLAELAESIKQHGLLEPIVVRETDARPPTDRPMAMYEIVAGERWFRACELAGLTEVPIRNLGRLDDRTALELALIENLQRVDLDPIEEAEGYRQLNCVVGKTQAEIAQAVNRSQPAVANAIRLLDLPEDVQALIRAGELSVSHGVALARWKEWPEFASGLTRVAATERMTTKKLETMQPSVYPAGQAARYLGALDKPEFAVCAACPFGARWESVSYGMAWCLKPSHYDQIKAEAEAKKAALERQRVERALAKSGAAGEEAPAKLPTLEGLGGYNAYRRLDSAPPGCGDDCPCRALVQGYRGEGTVVVCTDPKRFDRLAEEEKRRKQKERREEKARRLTEVAAAVDGLGEATHRELVLFVEHLVIYNGSGRIGVVREAFARLGLDLDADQLTGYHQGREGKRFRALARLSDRQLLRLGMDLILRRDIEDQFDEYRSGGHVADWYLGKADNAGEEVAGV